jgi:hypothetical protein
MMIDLEIKSELISSRKGWTQIQRTWRFRFPALSPQMKEAAGPCRRSQKEDPTRVCKGWHHRRVGDDPGVIASWIESKCRVRAFLQVLRYAARYIRMLHRGCTMKCIGWGALGIVASLFCTLVLSGCVGATKLPTKTIGPAGTKLENNEIDFTFLQAGTTRREEVVSKLNRIDTGYSSPQMFWGRWSESKWGHWGDCSSPWRSRRKRRP